MTRAQRLLVILVTVFFLILLYRRSDHGTLDDLDITTVAALEALSNSVDAYCRSLDERLYTESNPIESVLARAKRSKLVRDTLVYFPVLNQMWCLVPKAASTSWSQVLYRTLVSNGTLIQERRPGMSNLTKSIQVILKEKFGHINKMQYIDAVRNDDVKKILLVRHPFARIVSAYRDKLKNRKLVPDGAYFYQHYGAAIIRKYRKDRRIKQLEPTFGEFVDFLIAKDPIEYDEHWQPISLLCGLCHIKYHYVVRTESLKLYGPYLLNRLGFSSELKLGRDNSAEETSSLKDYYKSVSRSKMVLLYKKYEMDFHLFNYSFLQYYFP